MKHLAAEADARWEAKPRVMEDVATERPRISGADTTTETREQQTQTQTDTERQKKSEEGDPWARARTKGPSEDWQPAAWNPSAKR